MADPSLDPGTGDDTGGVGPDRRSTTGMPRWVKAFLIVALAVVLLLVILLLTGGGHGRGRHMSGGGVAALSSGQHNAGGVGEPADAAQAVRTVEVTTLDTMTFEPSMISVSAGETVTFVVANAGQIVHEFTLWNAAMQQTRRGDGPYACRDGPRHFEQHHAAARGDQAADLAVR